MLNRLLKEVIAIAIILVISICISIPAYKQSSKEYKAYQNSMENYSKEWDITSPEAQGIDSKLLEAADEFVKETDALSLLVVRHDKIVFEKYYNNSTMSSYNNIYSVTKSFISALVGIAIDKGYIKSVDEKISNYLPEYASKVDDPRKSEITIKHLLTMTPGFLEDLNKWLSSKNWVKHTFELPLNYSPGERFQYANSASHLLSVILTRATGMKTMDFAEKYLFSPLNIKEKMWITDAQGFNTGYANLFLKPRDMAKLGQLYLNKGIWKDNRIISDNWIEVSTKKHVDTDPEKTKDTPTGYGYKWWTFRESGFYVYIAAGYGGQNICVFPELDLLVVTTSLPDSKRSFNDMDRAKLLNEYIIPAVKDKK